MSDGHGLSEIALEERLAQAESDRTLCERTLDIWNEKIMRLEAALREIADSHGNDYGNPKHAFEWRIKVAHAALEEPWEQDAEEAAAQDENFG